MVLFFISINLQTVYLFIRSNSRRKPVDHGVFYQDSFSDEFCFCFSEIVISFYSIIEY